MHPTESQLLAWIDGEMPAEEAKRIRDHLATCPACEATRAGLEAMVAENRAALDLLEIDTPSISASEVVERARSRGAVSSGSRGLLKAASLAALVVTAAAALGLPGSPVREAALRWVEGLASDESPAPAGVPQGVGPGVAMTVSDRLVVEFVDRQAEGTIEIAVEPGPKARVQASAGGVSFTVSDDLVTVGNAGSNASYVITLPERLFLLEVRVDGTTVLRQTGATSPDTIPFPSFD